MSSKVDNAVDIVLVDTAERIRESTGVNRVCLSGGCFLNTLLLETTIAEMKERVFQVYFHTEVPAGDGGVSLGQAGVSGGRGGGWGVGRGGKKKKKAEFAETQRGVGRGGLDAGFGG